MRTHDPTITVLIVDDEIAVLRALRRVLRKSNFDLIFANSGAKALSLLDEHHVDILVTDMKMPSMSGDELLMHVNNAWPDIKKILLSGYTEKEALMSALNKGGVDCFIEKPWDNTELSKQIIKMAGQVLTLRQESYIQAKLQLSHEKLKCVRNELELQLKASGQTNTLNALLAVTKAYPNLDSVFASRVAHTAAELGAGMKLNNAAVENLRIAGKLCEIGTIGICEQALKPFQTLTANLKRIYQDQSRSLNLFFDQCPDLFQIKELLMGQFLPLSSEQATIEHRIFAVARDYWKMRMGKWLGTPMNENAACAELRKYQGIRYDAEVIKLFMALITHIRDDENQSYISLQDLKEGMILESDIVNTRGRLVLSCGHKLSRSCITKLHRLRSGISQFVYVSANAGANR